MKTLLAVILLSVMVSGCSKQEDPFNPQETCVYKVSGTCGTADILYYDSQGNLIQLTGVTLPYSYTFDQSPGFYASLDAYSDANTNTNLTASISENGTVKKSATATGPYCSVSVTQTL